MHRLRRLKPLMRAIAVIGTVSLLVSGVSYAALQSQQALLTNNSIESATADLRIGTSSSSFAASRTGFSFKDAIPGGSAVPTDGNTFYLKNYGTAVLALKMSVSSSPGNVANVDLDKVFVLITRVDVPSQTQTLSLSSLVSANAGGGVALSDNLSAGAVGQYKLQVSMAADAFSGTGAIIDDIDFVFSGSAVIQ